jgi:hypothetical protein
MARDSTEEQARESLPTKDRFTSHRNSTLEETTETEERYDTIFDALTEGTKKFQELCELDPSTVELWCRYAMEQNQQRQQAIDKLESDVDHLRLMVDMAKDIIDHDRNDRTRRTETNQESTPNPRLPKSTKLPDPEVFKDNKDRKIDQWMAAMDNKIQGNADHYPTDRDKIHYVVTRIGGEAFDIIEPRMKVDSAEPFTNAQEVLDALCRVYGDSNKVKTARREFKHLI